MKQLELTKFEEGKTYCSDQVFGESVLRRAFKGWSDFKSAYGEADKGSFLIFRWQCIARRKYDNIWYGITLFGYDQRKGKLVIVDIGNIEMHEEGVVIEYLRGHFNTLVELWKPVSGDDYKTYGNSQVNLRLRKAQR